VGDDVEYEWDPKARVPQLLKKNRDNGPDTSSADAVRTKPAYERFTESALSRLPNYETITKAGGEAIKHPLDTLQNLTVGSGVGEAWDQIR
jgi:hypothetical protein